MLTTEDRLAIHETLALHAHLVDDNELGRLDELFTPDAVYDMGPVGLGTFTGLAVIRAAAAQMFASGHSPVAHYLTNVMITSSDGDEATARSKGLMIMADGAIEGVTHVDTLRRQDGGWRISRRVITPTRPTTSREVGEDRPIAPGSPAPQPAGVSA